MEDQLYKIPINYTCNIYADNITLQITGETKIKITGGICDFKNLMFNGIPYINYTMSVSI